MLILYLQIEFVFRANVNLAQIPFLEIGELLPRHALAEKLILFRLGSFFIQPSGGPLSDSLPACVTDRRKNSFEPCRH